MDDAKRTEIRDMLFEGANAYSELEDLLVKAGDAIVEGADPERVVDALEQVIVAHRECSRGLFVTLTQLDSPLRTELAQSLGEIAFNAYTEARANRNHDGSKTPPWEELGAVQEGWEACARTLFAMGVAAASEAGPLAVLCTCGRDAGERFYSAHGSNPDGHAVGCPKWGPKK